MPASCEVRVTSSDGVELVGQRRGSGPALLLVYGTLTLQKHWARLARSLERDYTVYSYDRRGRGESGDSAEYASRLEIDDLAGFRASIPGPIDLFAHSSGGLLALMAAQAGVNFRRLVVYEPLIPLGRKSVEISLRLPDAIRTLVAAGDRGGALEFALRETMHLSGADIARLRKGSRWQEQLGYVHTVAYDALILEDFALRLPQVAGQRIRCLCLVGERSPQCTRHRVERLMSALPYSRLEILPGQRHDGPYSAPELTAKSIKRFLAEP